MNNSKNKEWRLHIEDNEEKPTEEEIELLLDQLAHIVADIYLTETQKEDQEKVE